MSKNKVGEVNDAGNAVLEENEKRIKRLYQKLADDLKREFARRGLRVNIPQGNGVIASAEWILAWDKIARMVGLDAVWGSLNFGSDTPKKESRRRRRGK